MTYAVRHVWHLGTKSMTYVVRHVGHLVTVFNEENMTYSVRHVWHEGVKLVLKKRLSKKEYYFLCCFCHSLNLYRTMYKRSTITGMDYCFCLFVCFFVLFFFFFGGGVLFFFLCHHVLQSVNKGEKRSFL